MTRKTLSIGVVLTVAALTLSIALVALGASNCMLENDGFRATVSTSVYNGPPPIPLCMLGVPLVQVEVSIRGKGGVTGSTTQIRCGILSDPVTLTVNGREHLIAPGKEKDWEDTLTDCGALIYKVN